MAKPKKRLQRLVDAVSRILGDDVEARKLRKAKALRRFLGKLEDRKQEIERDLSKRSGHGNRAAADADQVRRLEKQIKKGRKILADME